VNENNAVQRKIIVTKMRSEKSFDKVSSVNIIMTFKVMCAVPILGIYGV
jgi:hypothetical protein